jgi:hypothetical protein
MTPADTKAVLDARGPMTNLLTNSQWMACSGSTLENVGSALITGFTNNGTYPFETFTLNADGINIDSAINTAGYGICGSNTVVGTAGKLYRYTTTLTINSGTLSSIIVALPGATGGDTGDQFFTPVNGLNTIVFELPSTHASFSIAMRSDDGIAVNFSSTGTSLYEVTPGYVAADTLAPDGGTKTATLDIHRAEADSTHCKGYYGLKYTKGADTAEYHNILSITNRGQLDKFKGQTVTFGMAGYSVTATDNLKIQIYDGVTAVTSSAFWGADALGWKEISQAVAANATELTFRVLLDGDTADVAYGSFYMAVNGRSIGEYSYAPKSEQILCDANIALTGYTATTSAADGIIKLEAASSGMIGKGVKAVLVKAYGKDSAAGDGVGFDVQSASGVEDGISIDTQVNNIKIHGQGWVKTDSNGDIYLDHRGSGASALTLDIKVIGIQP